MKNFIVTKNLLVLNILSVLGIIVFSVGAIYIVPLIVSIVAVILFFAAYLSSKEDALSHYARLAEHSRKMKNTALLLVLFYSMCTIAVALLWFF